MDRRRRFVPAPPDGLEERKLLTTFSFNKNPYNIGNNDPTPSLIARSSRIEHLPHLLSASQSSGTGTRIAPPALVSNLQADLYAIEGQLHPAADSVKSFYENTIRGIVNDASLSQGDVQQLNNATTAMLRSAGANEGLIARFQADLTALARVDAASPRPVILATNDYATVLQIALVVGRPIKTPAVPKLAAADDTGTKGDNITAVTQPRLTGTYDADATIQIIDGAGNVLGSTTVGTSKKYTVSFSKALTPGTYVLAIRATFGGDIVSTPSPAFTLRIVPKGTAPGTTPARG